VGSFLISVLLFILCEDLGPARRFNFVSVRINGRENREDSTECRGEIERGHHRVVEIVFFHAVSSYPVQLNRIPVTQNGEHIHA